MADGTTNAPPQIVVVGVSQGLPVVKNLGTSEQGYAVGDLQNGLKDLLAKLDVNGDCLVGMQEFLPKYGRLSPFIDQAYLEIVCEKAIPSETKTESAAKPILPQLTLEKIYERLDKVIAAIDANGSGIITKEEFNEASTQAAGCAKAAFLKLSKANPLNIQSVTPPSTPAQQPTNSLPSTPSTPKRQVAKGKLA